MVILNVIGIYMRVERFFYIERPFDSCVLSYLASMPFEGHITEQTTVKWSIALQVVAKDRDNTKKLNDFTILLEIYKYLH